MHKLTTVTLICLLVLKHISFPCSVSLSSSLTLPHCVLSSSLFLSSTFRSPLTPSLLFSPVSSSLTLNHSCLTFISRSLSLARERIPLFRFPLVLNFKGAVIFNGSEPLEKNSSISHSHLIECVIFHRK